MEPTLRDGDWLLVDPLGYRNRPPQPGDLVVADAERRVIKRVARVNDERLTLRGDHPAHADDTLSVDRALVAGRPWFRYWPPRRMGRVR